MVNEKLRQLNERVGMMTLRERALVFAAAVVVVFALVQVLWIDAAQQRVQRANGRLQAAGDALAQISQQQAVFAGRNGLDPDRAAREALATQEARLAELGTELAAYGRSLVPPERMQAVLKEVVSRQDGVRIVGFKTLGPKPVVVSDAAAEAPPGFYEHGVEVTVSGPYAGLVAYLERLEALPWRFNWVEARLDASGRPDLKLTLTIHTLSLEEAWLRV